MTKTARRRELLPLTPDQNLQFQAWRASALEQMPYFARLLFAVRPVNAPGLGTWAVDASYRLYIDFDAVMDKGTKWNVESVLHEASHLYADHAAFAADLGITSDTRKAWNVACFPAGTLLPGNVPIEEVATMSREYDGELVGIKTTGGFVEATTEHPFLVRRRRHRKGVHPIVLNDAAWTLAEDIREGDYLCVPNLSEKRADTRIDLSGYVAQGTDSLGRHTYGNRAMKSVPLNEDVAWLIGLYVAEGSSSPHIRFSLGAHEDAIMTRVERIAASLGMSASRSYSKDSGAARVMLGNIVFGRWLREHCGTNAYSKHIPDVILRHHDALIRGAFLRGLRDGDGCDYRRHGGVPVTKVETASKALMHDIVLLLAQDGIGGSAYTRPQKEGRLVRGRALPAGMLYGVQWNPDGCRPTERLLNGKVVSSCSHRWKPDSDGVWYPVTAATRRPFAGPVYNMTTDSHTYITHSFLVHNCDLAINDDLDAAGCTTFRSDKMLPAFIGEPDGQTPHYYLRVLQQKMAQQQSATPLTPAPRITITPSTIAEGKVRDRVIAGTAKPAFIDPGDFTLTVTGADGGTVDVRDVNATIGGFTFTVDTEAPLGTYTVEVASGGATAATSLAVETGTITVSPDHLETGWAAPQPVVVRGKFTEFSPNAVVTVTDPDTGVIAPVTATTWRSENELRLDIDALVPDGLYIVTVTDQGRTFQAPLPIGLPHMVLTPHSLVAGYGPGTRVEALVADFTLDDTTTFDVLLGGLAPIAGVFTPTVTSDVHAFLDFNLALSAGQYLVVATTGGEQATAILTITNSDGNAGDGKGSATDDQGDAEGDPGDEPFKGCGSGSGGERWDGELDPDDDLDGTAPAASSIEKETIRLATAAAVKDYVAKGRGKVPGGLVEIADKILAPSKTPWQKVIGSKIRRAAARKAGRFDTDTSRRSRRRHNATIKTRDGRRRAIIPGYSDPVIRIEVIRDTSGSMSATDLAIVTREVEGIARKMGVRDGYLTVTDVDAAVHQTVAYKNRSSMTKVAGRGGTNMIVGIEAACERREKPSVIVVVTDGGTPWPTEPPAIPVIAAIVPQKGLGVPAHGWSDMVPDFIQAVVVDPAER